MMDIFLNSDYSMLWSALGTVLQGFALVMSIFALIYTMTTFKKSLQNAHYTVLDTMYFDLLKIAMEKPHLTNPKTIRSDDQRIEYDNYAFMVWNFVEAIYDRCEKDKRLCSTWYPIIIEEDMKHREWFDDPANWHRFKDNFRGFIRDNRFKQG